MEHFIHSIDHRIAIKKIEIMNKELNKLDNDITLFNFQLNQINKSYSKVLLKDKPVGNSIKAIRYIKNECNCCN